MWLIQLYSPLDPWKEKKTIYPDLCWDQCDMCTFPEFIHHFQRGVSYRTGSLVAVYCIAWFFSGADGDSDFWSYTPPTLLWHFIAIHPSMHLCMNPSCTHSDLSIQVQTIMECYHLVHLAKCCQWPHAVQYPPLLPVLKTWNTRSCLLGPCRPSVHQTGWKSSVE